MSCVINVNHAPKVIFIGNETENDARRISFDLSAWVEEFGAGTAQLLIKRPGEAEAYSVLLTVNNGKADWLPSSTDTAIAGTAEIALAYSVGTVAIRTGIIFAVIDASIATGTTPPPGLESWVEQLGQLAEDAQAAAADAEAAKDDAEAAAASLEGALQQIEQNEDDISALKSASYNLLDPTGITPYQSTSRAELTRTGFVIRNTTATTYTRGYLYLNLKPSTEYTFSLRKHTTSGAGFVGYAEAPAEGEAYPSANTALVSRTDPDDETITKTFTTSNGIMIIRFYATWDVAELGEVEYREIMVFEGTEEKPYVRHVFAQDDEARNRVEAAEEKLTKLDDLSGEVDDLKSALSSISDLNSISVTVVFEQGYRHLRTGCTLKSSNSWCTSTTPVSLLKGSTISIETGYKYQLIDPTPENNGAVLVSQTSEQYTATSDVNAYIEVRNEAATAVTPSQAQSVVTVTKIPPIVTMLNTSADILSDISVRSKNLFDKNDIVNGELVRSSDGAFVTNANFWRSSFIPVTGGETYTLRYVNQVGFYSDISTASFISGVNGYSTDTAATPSTFVAPSNAKYIVICGHNAQLDSDQLEIGDSFTGYVEYGYIAKQSSGQSYIRISDIMSKIIFANSPVKIKLIGDSTTAGQGGTGYTNDATHGELILTDDGYGSYYTNPDGYCWANLLKSYFEDHFNCTVTNFGCSGMRVHRMVLYLDTLIAEDDDIVIFMGGLNDRNDNSAHTTLQNLASDIQAIIDYCLSRNKSIVIMSPIPTLDNETGTKNFKTDDIDHVYMYLANLNKMEYISVFEKINDYCLNSGTALSSLLNTDSLHPNDTGYSMMYYAICTGLGINVYPVSN